MFSFGPGTDVPGFSILEINHLKEIAAAKRQREAFTAAGECCATLLSYLLAAPREAITPVTSAGWATAATADEKGLNIL